METPIFPLWRARLAGFGSRVQEFRRATLSQIEAFFAPFLPTTILSQADEGPNSRQRQFTLRRTFWGFLSQALNPGTSCRELVRQLQALLGLTSQKQIDAANSAYCQARARLPRERLHCHDVRLFRRLWASLTQGDIVLGDRAFADYVSLAQLPKKGVDLVCRLHQARKIDFRKGRRLGRRDACFTWKKPPLRPKYLTRRQ